jgi:DNA-binding MarR family transcriptional regulator
MGDLVLDNERRREVSAALGISFGRIRALRRIGRSPMTMGELASALGVDAPNVTQVVDELEALGLVERQPHPTDRRAKLVATTPRGAKAVRKANAILSRPPDGLARLSDDELTVLVELLGKATAP